MGADLDCERGTTTTLPQELDANIPLLRWSFDARGAPEYVEKWCACLRLGTNRECSNREISRFRKPGDLEQYADSMKYMRRLQSAVEIVRKINQLSMEGRVRFSSHISWN